MDAFMLFLWCMRNPLMRRSEALHAPVCAEEGIWHGRSGLFTGKCGPRTMRVHCLTSIVVLGVVVFRRGALGAGVNARRHGRSGLFTEKCGPRTMQRCPFPCGGRVS